MFWISAFSEVVFCKLVAIAIILLISASSGFVLWVGGHSHRKCFSAPCSEYVVVFKCP